MAPKKITDISSITTVPNNMLLMICPPPGVGGRNSSFQIQNTSKTKYKQAVHGGCDCSSKITTTHKHKASLDKHNGKYKVIKEEMKYNKSSFKVNNKIQGCTTKYETEVKVNKKVTTISNPNKGSCHKKVSISHANSSKGRNNTHEVKKVTTKKVTTSSGRGKGPGSCGCKININFYGY